MNRQLLRLRQRSNGDVLQVAEADDDKNLYVNVDAGTLNEVEHVTNVDSIDLITEVSNVSDVDSVNLVDRITLVDEVNKSVTYGINQEDSSEYPVSLTDEGSVWIKNIQDSRTVHESVIFSWPDSAVQFTGYEHIFDPIAPYVYDKHVVYVANPSMDTALNLSVRNDVDMFGSTVYGQVYSAVVPAASYMLFKSTAWSSCFTSIGGVLVDQSANINDTLPPQNDVPFEFGAVNDAIYFGDIAPFQRMRITIGTAGVYDASGIWEYWNGSAWTAIPEIYDDSNATVHDGTKSFSRTGSRYIQWQIDGDWTAYDIASDPTSQYWVRWRITNFTSRTSGPALNFAYYKPVGKANVHGYIVEGMFNGGKCKVTLENATAVPAGSGFPAEIYIRSV